MNSVQQHIDVLKKAREFDREIYLAQIRLNEIPGERSLLKRELDGQKSHLLELEAALKKAQLAQKAKEGGLGEKEAHIRKLDGQLGAVKTNKEYTALQQEIASLKADNSVLEEEIIRLIDEVEAADEEVRKEKEHLKQVEKEFQTRDQELALKEKTLAESVGELKKKRQEVMSQVPPDISTLYDLIVSKKQGIGLARVIGENCEGCQLQLRPQLMNEIRMGNALIICENCSRILYYEDQV